MARGMANQVPTSWRALSEVRQPAILQALRGGSVQKHTQVFKYLIYALFRHTPIIFLSEDLGGGVDQGNNWCQFILCPKNTDCRHGSDYVFRG